MVACGAAAGISATFNAPIAGVIFALELILRDFTAESFGVVVLASVVADVIGRAAVGGGAFLTLPPFALTSLWEYGLYAGLGVLAALAGVGFIRVLYGSEDIADRLWRGPEWLRPCVGGLALGAVLLLAARRCTASDTRCSSGPIRGEYVGRLPAPAAGGEDARDQPDDRDRRLRRRLRPVAVHGRHARGGLRTR